MTEELSVQIVSCVPYLFFFSPPTLGGALFQMCHMSFGLNTSRLVSVAESVMTRRQTVFFVLCFFLHLGSCACPILSAYAE